MSLAQIATELRRLITVRFKDDYVYTSVCSLHYSLRNYCDLSALVIQHDLSVAAEKKKRKKTEFSLQRSFNCEVS